MKIQSLAKSKISPDSIINSTLDIAYRIGILIVARLFAP